MLKNMGEAVERAAERVIGAAIEVHRNLGPGYLESVYEEALRIELELQGIAFQKQLVFALDYKGHPVGEGWLDFLVEGCLIVEIKAVDMLAAVHTMQIASQVGPLHACAGAGTAGRTAPNARARTSSFTRRLFIGSPFASPLSIRQQP